MGLNSLLMSLNEEQPLAYIKYEIEKFANNNTVLILRTVLSLHTNYTHTFFLIAFQRLTERPAVHWASVCLVYPQTWPCVPVQ